jgi:hypothetical protein
MKLPLAEALGHCASPITGPRYDISAVTASAGTHCKKTPGRQIIGKWDAMRVHCFPASNERPSQARAYPVHQAIVFRPDVGSTL